MVRLRKRLDLPVAGRDPGSQGGPLKSSSPRLTTIAPAKVVSGKKTQWESMDWKRTCFCDVALVRCGRRDGVAENSGAPPTAERGATA